MGIISLEQLLPEQFRDPDEAVPISPLRLPVSADVMLAGFNAADGDPVRFEGEKTVSVRLCERTWRYLQLPDKETQMRRRTWRLEFGVPDNKKQTLRWGHYLVVAQKPYGNGWQQSARFKQRSKELVGMGSLPEVPQLKSNEDPIEWLEWNVRNDPWEQSRRIIAGISHPHGFMSLNPRNSGGDLILGASPDPDRIVERILKEKAIEKLIRLTEKGTLRFWDPKVVTTPPVLLDEVKAACHIYMWNSVRLALAGPRKSASTWKDRPVSDLVSQIYRDQVNMHNKAEQTRKRHEDTAPDELEAVERRLVEKKIGRQKL